MPTSNLGTGTQYYGKRDFWPDDSYTTTEFIAAFWVPLIPIRSLRVKRIGMGGMLGLLGPGIRTRYAVFSIARPNVKQIASVYGFVALLAGFTVAYTHAADKFPRIPINILAIGAFVGIALLSTLPFLLRRNAKRKLNRHQR